MAAITALTSNPIVADTPSAVVGEIRKQWNAFVANVAALDSSTATAAQIVTALQLSVQVITSFDHLPPAPHPSH